MLRNEVYPGFLCLWHMFQELSYCTQRPSPFLLPLWLPFKRRLICMTSLCSVVQLQNFFIPNVSNFLLEIIKIGKKIWLFCGLFAILWGSLQNLVEWLIQHWQNWKSGIAYKTKSLFFPCQKFSPRKQEILMKSLTVSFSNLIFEQLISATPPYANLLCFLPSH